MNSFKKNSIYALSVFTLMGMASCANDNLNVDEPQPPVLNAEGYFLTFNVETVPTVSTRSATNANGDTENVDAAANESQLKDALLYFVDANNNILIDPVSVNENAVIDTGLGKQITGADGTFNIAVKVNPADLVGLCNKGDIYLIIVGNATETSLTYNFSNEEGKKAANAAKFTVSSFDDVIQPFGNDKAGKVLPLVSYDRMKLTADFNSITDASSSNLIPIYNLFSETYGTNGKQLKLKSESSDAVVLERAVARIDFNDGGERNGLKQFCYKLADSNVTAKIVAMEVFNVNSQSYLFRHTIEGTPASAFGASKTALDDTQLFGKENGGLTNGNYNWIYPCDWSNSGFDAGRTLLNRYSNRGSEANAKANLSYFEKTGENSILQNGFYPWIYITENVIPTTALMDSDDDRQDNATGIAFTFRFVDDNGDAITASSTNLPAGVKIIGDDDTKQLRVLQSDGKYFDFDFDGTDGTIEKTYIGWIKHNDPTDGVDPMEYAIVRNNVYQCKVTSVGGLIEWHEAESLFLTLQVNVRQWQKRDNSFNF
ncbi:MAG: fimbria major subunit [Muribaculaceae bacterium]|nr:fimbria major subunit [Muribaculaceae bacterium]